MNSENLLKSEKEQYDPNLEAQDEEVLSGGNNRLMYILVAVMVALIVAYVALPKGQGSALAAVAPSFMLDDASVTATLPTSNDSIAAGLKTAPVVTPAIVAKTTTSATAKPTTTPKQVTAATKPSSAVAADAALPVAAAPSAASAPAVVPDAAPAAPSTISVKGKIDDENGRPMVGATIFLKGSNKGTSTDANGNYTLDIPSGSENTLVYGYGGYEDESIRVRKDQSVNVTLTPRAKESKRRK